MEGWDQAMCEVSSHAKRGRSRLGVRFVQSWHRYICIPLKQSPHFTDEEAESQRGCDCLHFTQLRWQGLNSVLKPKHPHSKPFPPHLSHHQHGPFASLDQFFKAGPRSNCPNLPAAIRRPKESSLKIVSCRCSAVENTQQIWILFGHSEESKKLF